uniref:Putative isomerase YddE n=1 Tax=uncultured Actinomycetes bacterium TaxID=152507 RepID=A0A871Y6X7_9ACTN|nr:putative isomerase YddE [uncultured Actinomycetes bacterium]
MHPEILRLAAFPLENAGGNPAGVVLDATNLSDSQMQALAKEVGFSETAFITTALAERMRVRYFSPEMEVDFCGHATIATGVALGEINGPGEYIFETNTGDVGVEVTKSDIGYIAELSSTTAMVSQIETTLLDELLEILHYNPSNLDPSHPVLIANAGNAHPIMILENPDTLQNLDYNFDALKALCRSHNWPTVQLLATESPGVWQSRNPFAFGGVYEDPATGSAAAAFGVYLRDLGFAKPGDTVIIKQGFTMSQPSLLKVTIEATAIKVAGGAIHL